MFGPLVDVSRSMVDAACTRSPSGWRRIDPQAKGRGEHASATCVRYSERKSAIRGLAWPTNATVAADAKHTAHLAHGLVHRAADAEACRCQASHASPAA